MATARRTFPPVPASAGEARRFVAEVVADAELGPAFAVSMLVSELVANVVLHAATPAEVVVRAGDGRVRVEVGDTNAMMPVQKHYSSMSRTGRGLLLVERMASDWGADRTDNGGKVVWFELDGRSSAGLDLLEVEAL